MENSLRKYLMVFDQDVKWGLYVTSLGRTIIESHEEYPTRDHPDSYIFSWKNGRILSEFQLVLLTQGEGIFESVETGEIKLVAGDMLMLFPGTWHRYKPANKTGWTERWVGFSGIVADQFLANGFFYHQEPIISKCNTSAILNYFNSLFQLFEEEPFGFQRIASGICLQMMGELQNIRSGGNNLENIQSIVTAAKKIMYKNINHTIDLEKIAADLGVSYSKFRSDFKKQTGVPPLQYYLSLKIEKSKEILLNTSKSQKEIAFEMGFESDFYFNRLFKLKTGRSPGQFRGISR